MANWLQCRTDKVNSCLFILTVQGSVQAGLKVHKIYRHLYLHYHQLLHWFGFLDGNRVFEILVSHLNVTKEKFLLAKSAPRYVWNYKSIHIKNI